MNCDMCVYRIAMPGFEHRVGEPQHPHDHPHDPAHLRGARPWMTETPVIPQEQRDAMYRVIAERRDVRRGFRPDPVPADVLGRVLAAAHQAPSVGFSQPWDFIVITERARRERIAALARRHRGRVRGGPARRPGPRVRSAEDRVDPRHAGQHRGQLRPHPRRPAHARPARPAADRRVLQRARGGEPMAGGPGRGPRRRLGELLRRARARRRARAARAPGGDRLPLRGLRHRVRGRTRTPDGRLGASPAGVVGGARRGVRPPRNARGGTSGPARRPDRRDHPARRRGDGRRSGNGRTG